GLARDRVVDEVTRGDDPELVARLQAPVVPGVEVEEVVLREVGLFGLVLGPDDRGDELIGVRPDVSEAGNLVLVPEGLRRRLRGPGGRGLDTGDPLRLG